MQEWELREYKTLLTYLAIFIGMSCNIFIFCYIAEILTDQVAVIAYKIFSLSV